LPERCVHNLEASGVIRGKGKEQFPLGGKATGDKERNPRAHKERPRTADAIPIENDLLEKDCTKKATRGPGGKIG